METWDAIRARRNVRSYQTGAVPAGDLDRIAEAAWRAPSASNRQHWDSVGDQDQARTILGVPAGHDVAFLLGVGYPADRPLRPIAKPSRRPLGEVIHHGRW